MTTPSNIKSLSAALLCSGGLLSAPLMAQNQGLERAPTPPKLKTGEAASLKKQAGVGGNYAYSEAGVVEVGGAINYSSTESSTSAGLTPSIGYFFVDNFQISALTNFTYTHLKDGDGARDDDTFTSGSLVLEPSVHTPLSRTQFLFGGLGVGAYVAQDADTGFALAPRVGFKNLVGRSGMVSVALQGVYALNESEDSDEIEGTAVTVENGVNLAFGYSVLL